MPNHDRASYADGDAFGSVGEAAEQSQIPIPVITSDPMITATSIVSHLGVRFSGCSFTPLFGRERIRAVMSYFTGSVFALANRGAWSSLVPSMR